MAEFGVFCAASRWLSMAGLPEPPMQCHGSLQFPDFRTRACSHRSLFVRRTPTRPRTRGQEPHFTQRLVRSVRWRQRGDPSRGPRPAHQQRRLGRRAAVAHLHDADRPGGRPPLHRERTGTAPDPPPQASWTTLRRRLAGQRRVTAVFRQADGRMLHVCKATRAESWQRAIHERLGVDASPGGVRKLVVQPRRRKENARTAVPHA